MSSAARDRVGLLADPGSLEEFPPVGRCGLLAAGIKVNGRRAYVSATDGSAAAQSPMDQMLKQVAFLEQVQRDPAPVVLILDTPAHVRRAAGKTPIPPDAQRLLADGRGVGRGYCLLARLSAVAPMICVVFNQVGAALSFPSALGHAAVMVQGSAVCVGRPDAVRLMTGQNTDFERLGGARMHCEVSGLGDALARTERGAMAWARRWLEYVPDRAGAALPVREESPPAASAASAEAALPEDLNAAFDMRLVLEAVADSGSILELKALHAAECVTALCRVKGRVLGLVANNSLVRGGIIFPETCRKMARFIGFCDAFGLPLAFFADTPGFMVGEQVERRGNVREAAELMSAIARSRVPKMCLVVRKAYSAGLYAMAGPGFEPVEFLALPKASISVFGPEALERFSADRDMAPAARQALDRMLAGARDPEVLARAGLLDEVVDWRDLRGRVARFVAGGHGQPAG
ncbi:MAG: hypothetical protein JW718_07295 [Desulfovibrionaceae bacterium]|nr:hypothetical protein [Desulfovibrionaceae bacterium]